MDTAAERTAKECECGRIERVKRPPEAEMVIMVMIGTIQTGPTLDMSREFCPIIMYTRPNEMTQERQQSIHQKPHNVYSNAVPPVPQSRLTDCVVAVSGNTSRKYQHAYQSCINEGSHSISEEAYE